MHSIRSGVFAIVFAGAAGVAPARFTNGAPPLVVHEWGTITTVHSRSGTPSGCLNRISGSDPLPEFVHRFEPAGLAVPTAQPQPAGTEPGSARLPLTKSPFAACRPDVTMRLETPVIYFHPAAGARSIPPFDVNVHFRGGVVNEFYPNANAAVMADEDQPGNGETLGPNVVGELHWRGLTLSDSPSTRGTDAHVWLAPRAVHSAGVLTKSGEAERYLFYRGVAHLDAVIRSERTSTDVRLLAPTTTEWMRGPSAEIGGAWLVDIRPNGTAAFRNIGPLHLAKSARGELANVPLFSADTYTAGALGDLRASMKQSLVSAGLFDDEAAAMLETWSESYFRTPGLRVFYLVPREWTDYFLPLDISVPNVITRVIVGRIDLSR
jgi:hypothetical protein